jgi:hypothetical protein
MPANGAEETMAPPGAEVAPARPGPGAVVPHRANMPLIQDPQLRDLLRPKSVTYEEWLRAVVDPDAEFPDDDEHDAVSVLVAILGAETSAAALAATNLQRAQDLCGDGPGAHSARLDIRGAQTLKSTYEEGAACYVIVDSVNMATGEEVRWTTGARAIQACILKHMYEGWMPFPAIITRKRTPTKKGFYPLNLEAGG